MSQPRVRQTPVFAFLHFACLHFACLHSHPDACRPLCRFTTNPRPLVSVWAHQLPTETRTRAHTRTRTPSPRQRYSRSLIGGCVARSNTATLSLPLQHTPPSRPAVRLPRWCRRRREGVAAPPRGGPCGGRLAIKHPTLRPVDACVPVCARACVSATVCGVSVCLCVWPRMASRPASTLPTPSTPRTLSGLPGRRRRPQRGVWAGFAHAGRAAAARARRWDRRRRRLGGGTVEALGPGDIRTRAHAYTRTHGGDVQQKWWRGAHWGGYCSPI